MQKKKKHTHNGFIVNADAHLKRTVMGSEAEVAVTEGKLDFRKHGNRFFTASLTARFKKALVKIIGE